MLKQNIRRREKTLECDKNTVLSIFGKLVRIALIWISADKRTSYQQYLFLLNWDAVILKPRLTKVNET